MATNAGIHSNLAIPPGEYLQEVIADLGMTKDELARRMDRPAAKLSAIFKGDKSITPDTALRLERVLGVPAHVWTGLESEYRLTLSRQEAESREQQLIEEISLASKYPYNDLVKAGEIERNTRKTERVRDLQRFLGVVSLKNVPDLKRYQAAFRYSKSNRGERSFEAVAAWLRMGERRAQNMRCAPFNKKKLQSALGSFRQLTLKSPEKWQDELEQELSKCGVALIICRHFPGAKAYGATFWISRDKAVLMITFRGKWADIFWFSLFHEIGHIVLHGHQDVILEDDIKNEKEEEADKFASDTLIPPKDYKSFIEEKSLFHDDIKRFAGKIGISPGIVVGRLQHEELLRQNWMNDLRDRYEWKSSP